MRGRQIDVIPAIHDAVRQGHKRIVVQAPTGYGKTVVAAHLMDRSAKKGKRPIFIAPAIALVEQTLKSFEDQGIRDIGIIQAKHQRTDFMARIQIASRDTLVRRPLPEVDFVLVDECHDQRDKLNEILNGEAWKNKIVIGLSATPWSKGMGLHWTRLVVAATMAQMIDDGAPTGLSRFVIYGAQHEPDTTGLKTVGDDFQESGAAKAMSEEKIIGDVVETWLKHRQMEEHPGDRTFLYGVNRAHAKALMEAFKARDINCGYVDGESSADDRVKTFKRYRNGEDKVLANVGVLVTGVDEDVRCLIDCALSKSEIRHVQRWGRGARLADGKDYCLGLDHAGNCTRLGYPWDIHHEELDTREPKSKDDAYEDDKPAPKPRKCKKCHAIIPPATRACPTCGDVYVAENTIMHEKGELALLTSSTKATKKVQAEKKEKQVWYSGLLYIANTRGFKDGWASNKYRERFGCWPQGLERTAKHPIKAVREFEQEQRRKFVESRKKEAVNG